ncbi:phage holin family protein [Nostocoides japonicum]|uniref:phage holin family protein n=1 Tax=Nostocoides japonicum TaxID=99481 RepID=UPI00065BC7F4|nr:phage holin family protein [Tetrasphaera japonica]
MAAGVPTGERTIGQLVADASHDVKHIVRGEIALAKAEMQGKAQVMGKGAGMLAAAAVLGLFGLLFVLHTIARVIALWLPIWAGYGIVALVLLIVAAVLALTGKKALSTVDPAPRKAIADVQQTVAAIKPGH